MMPTMTYDEFHRHLGKAGLRIHEFAGLVKMNPVSISNYGKKGHVPAHLAVIVTLLGEMAERKIDYRAILAQLQIEAKKPRGAGFGKFGGDKQSELFDRELH